jgi:hypothetical protein
MVSRDEVIIAGTNQPPDLPGLADLFDSQTPQPFFKGSKVSALEELALTETKLLEQTASILGVSLAQLVKAGTLVYAKREVLNHQKYSTAKGGDSESALLRSDSGVAGVADARILAAYQAMAGANPPIPINPGQARHQSRHRLPHRLALAQDPSPRITGV